MNKKDNILNRAKNIRLALFDVDGVLTDGNIHIDENGKEIKTFNTHDGHGLRLLQHYNIEVGVISGRSSNALTHRMNDLNIRHVYQGVTDKHSVFEKLLKQLNIQSNQVSFVGDDIVDLQIMSHCGLSIAVANAHPFVKQHAHWETTATGGKGAVREVCELLLESQGLLKKALEFNLNKSS